MAIEVSGGTLKATPIELAAAGPDSVLGPSTCRPSVPGATLDQDGLQRFVVRDGTVSLHNLWSNQAEVDAFYA